MFATHFAYIQELQNNNSRARFHAHKELYDKLRDELIEIARDMIAFLDKDFPLWELNPKKCLFRINRDMRFVKDGQLYKNNMGLEMAPGGKRSGMPCFYIHIQSGGSFIGGGLYMPDKYVTESVRKAILADGENLVQIYKDLYTGGFTPYAERALKSYPRGYDQQHPHIELLRQRDRTFSKSFTDKQFCNPNIVKTIKKEFKKLMAFNLWLLHAVEG